MRDFLNNFLVKFRIPCVYPSTTSGPSNQWSSSSGRLNTVVSSVLPYGAGASGYYSVTNNPPLLTPIMNRKLLLLRTVCLVIFIMYSTSTLIIFDPGGEITTEILLQPPHCGHHEGVLVLVHSHAGHAHLRISQREAAALSKNIKLVFILFKSSSVDEEEIIKEHSKHGDILLGDKEESYKSLVYKHVMGLQWSAENCPDVEYVVKMDDDISVDWTGLINIVRKNQPKTAKMMMGMLQIRLPILRQNTSKWWVSEREYPGTHYPDFLSGWCYVTTMAGVRAVLDMVDMEPVFWVDDVWITGVLAHKAGVQLVSLNMFFTVYKEFLECCVKDRSLQCPYLVGPSEGDTTVLQNMARHAAHCRDQGRCDKRKSGMQGCYVGNPLFLPSKGVKAEVITV